MSKASQGDNKDNIRILREEEMPSGNKVFYIYYFADKTASVKVRCGSVILDVANYYSTEKSWYRIRPYILRPDVRERVEQQADYYAASF